MDLIVIFIRSFLFFIFFYVWAALWSIIGMLTLPLPRKRSLFPQEQWSRGMQKALPIITGIKVVYKGMENLPEEPVIVACKHQSAWETTVFQGLLKDPAIVLKTGLRDIPVFGWYVRKLKMIGVDRNAGSKALRRMLKEAKAAVTYNRKIVIFPEGTRVSAEHDAEFQAGVYALYRQLKLPVVPVALNSGLLWPRNSFLKRPGTIYLEFLPVIENGLSREEFMKRLGNDIDTATEKLEAMTFK